MIPTEVINSFCSYQVQKLSLDGLWVGLGDLGAVRPGDGRGESPWQVKLQGARGPRLIGPFSVNSHSNPIVTARGLSCTSWTLLVELQLHARGRGLQLSEACDSPQSPAAMLPSSEAQWPTCPQAAHWKASR